MKNSHNLAADLWSKPDLPVKMIHNGREMYEVTGVERRIGEDGKPYLVFSSAPTAPEILP